MASLSLALLATACNLQWSPYAAKVGSQEISPGQLDGALSKAGSDKEFRCLLASSSKSGYHIKGAGADTYDSTFVAFVLTNLVDSRLARAVVIRHGIPEPSGAQALADAQLVASFSTELADTGCGTSTTTLMRGLGSTLEEAFLGLQLDEDAIAVHAAHVPLTETGLTQYEAAHPASTRQSCISGIFVSSKSVADHVRTLLDHGASFATELKKYSVTSTSGTGALGCYTNSELSSIEPALKSSVAATSVGSVAKPVSYETYYLVLLVTSRPFESVVDALDTIFSTYTTVFSSTIAAAARHTRVEIDPEYGSWTEKSSSSGSIAGFGGHVRPLTGPANSSLLNAKATTGPLQAKPADSDG